MEGTGARRNRGWLATLAWLASLGAATSSLLVAAPATALGASPRPQAAVARSLLASTGLSPAQIDVRNVCPPAAPGQVACAAQEVVQRGGERPVRTRPGARARPERVVAARGASVRGAAQAAPAGASAQAPPPPDTPAYLQQAYDLAYLSQTGGQDDTVAIVDAFDAPSAESDLAYYRSYFGLPACTTANGCFRKVNEQGQSSPLPGTDADWEMEITLDIEAVSALCPNCHILLVEASSANYSDFQAAVQEAQTLGANQISGSFAALNNAPLALSVSVPMVAATGDWHYPGAGSDYYPAALPNISAAGGTSLVPASDGSGGRGFTESAWSDAGSGCDTQEVKPAWQSDQGCSGRAYADLSADADPETGLAVYMNGGWGLVGGTSLATPLTAAYYAITGAAAQTPQWAYRSAGQLNDVVSGNNSTSATPCAPSIAYICQAGVGYDGPTGVGSISGAVVQGAPGIGGPTVPAGQSNSYVSSLTATGATLVGGVYPNGLDTQYWWQYGPSTAYGQSTPATDAGAGTSPVGLTATLSGLSASTTYHLRLVAQNSAGTTYGYDYTFTTPAGGPPVNLAPPQISGTAQPGQTLAVSPGTWSPNGIYAEQWERCDARGLGCQPIAGASGSTYTITSADLGSELTVVVTALNSAGRASAAAVPVGPVTSASRGGTPQSAPPTILTAPRLHVSGAAAPGTRLFVDPGRYSGASQAIVQFWRCDPRCVPIGVPGIAASVRVSAADAGAFIRARVTVSGPGGTTSTWADGVLGPIRGPGAASGALRASRRAVLRDVRRTALADVWRARAASASRAGNVSIAVARPRRARGQVVVWACAVSPSALGPCTAAHRVGTRSVVLSLQAPPGEQIEVVARRPSR